MNRFPNFEFKTDRADNPVVRQWLADNIHNPNVFEKIPEAKYLVVTEFNGDLVAGVWIDSLTYQLSAVQEINPFDYMPALQSTSMEAHMTSLINQYSNKIPRFLNWFAVDIDGIVRGYDSKPTAGMLGFDGDNVPLPVPNQPHMAGIWAKTLTFVDISDSVRTRKESLTTATELLEKQWRNAVAQYHRPEPVESCTKVNVQTLAIRQLKVGVNNEFITRQQVQRMAYEAGQKAGANMMRKIVDSDAYFVAHHEDVIESINSRLTVEDKNMLDMTERDKRPPSRQELYWAGLQIRQAPSLPEPKSLTVQAACLADPKFTHMMGALDYTGGQRSE